MKCFINMKSLRLNFYNDDNNPDKVIITSNELNGFPDITHFRLESKKLSITNSFFTSIDEYLPKLQSIECNNAAITEEAFKSLSKLAKLEKITLLSVDELDYDNNSYVNTCHRYTTHLIIETLNDIIRNCRKIKTIRYYSKDSKFYINDKIISDVRKGKDIKHIIAVKEELFDSDSTNEVL